MKITYNNEEKYLFKTSSALILPSVIGFYRGNYITSIANVLACVISGCFWYNPRLGIRRNVDLFYQPIFGTYMYFLGCYKSTNIIHLILGNVFCFNGLFLYYKSCDEYRKHNRLWYIYHGLFHISMISSCTMVHLGI